MDKIVIEAARKCTNSTRDYCFGCPFDKEYEACSDLFAKAIVEEYKDKESEEPQKVDHPSHYQGEYECIDLMREIFGDDAVRYFCIINAYKYRFRAGNKEGSPHDEDIKKAAWYENYVMKNLSNNANTDALNIKRLIGETNDLRRSDPRADAF